VTGTQVEIAIQTAKLFETQVVAIHILSPSYSTFNCKLNYDKVNKY